jgi:hypothetical protein
MKKKKIILTLSSAVAFFPHIAFAQVETFRDLMQIFANLAGNAMLVVYAAAFAGFFLGIFLFVSNMEDEKKREEGKKWMLWSIISLFAMIAVWGLVNVLVGTFGLTPNVIPQLPGA